MGKITNALKKAAEERMEHLDKKVKLKERERFIVKKVSESSVNPAIITHFDPKALVSEQFKVLRTNILSMNKGVPPKVFGVTSSIHAEGKTVTSLNLAVSLSQAMHKPKVLLVDADMRKGKMAKYLGVDQKIGLSDILEGKEGSKEAIFNIEDENLAFIASGEVPEYPSELLSSKTFKNFLSDMRNQFDHVIIDTPPIVPVTDAGIIGAQLDGLILVVQAGRTQRGVVRRAEELLYQSHSKVLGHVLTNIEYHLPEYIYRYL